MINLEDWAKEQAELSKSHEHDAGLTADRNYHAGRRAVFSLAAGDTETTAYLLGRNLRLSGSRGSRFIAGMRDAAGTLDGARAVLARIAQDNASAFSEPVSADA